MKGRKKVTKAIGGLVLLFNYGFWGAAHAACGGNYGEVIGEFMGINAYSNGSNWNCAGTIYGEFQCVEFIDRVHPATLAHQGNAATYNDGQNPRRMNMIYYKNNNGTYSPLPGDIVVSDSGHVGIVKSVTPPYAQIVHQNWPGSNGYSSGYLKVTLGGINNAQIGPFSTSYPIAGWLRPGWDFTNLIDSASRGIYGWSLSNASIVNVDATGISIDPAMDPNLTSPSGLSINPTLYRKAKIRLKTTAPDGEVRVYFTTTKYTGWNNSQSEAAYARTDGQWTTVTVNMGVNGYWVYGGRINQIRIDPVRNGNSTQNDKITLDAVWLEP